MEKTEIQVKKIHFLAVVAGFLGTFTILSVVVSLPILFSDLEDIQSQIEADMMDFKVKTETLNVKINE